MSPYRREEWLHLSGYWWLYLPTGRRYRGQRTSWGGTIPPGAPPE
jgi:hypothetical protein